MSRPSIRSVPLMKALMSSSIGSSTPSLRLAIPRGLHGSASAMGSNQEGMWETAPLTEEERVSGFLKCHVLSPLFAAFVGFGAACYNSRQVEAERVKTVDSSTNLVKQRVGSLHKRIENEKKIIEQKKELLMEG